MLYEQSRAGRDNVTQSRERYLLRFVRVMEENLVTNHIDPNRSGLLCVDKAEWLVSIEIVAAKH